MVEKSQERGCKLMLSEGGRASALEALKRRPDIPDQVFQGFHLAWWIAASRRFPRAIKPLPSEDSYLFYWRVVVTMLTESQIDHETLSAAREIDFTPDAKAAASEALLEAVCAAGFVLMLAFWDEPEAKGPLPALDANGWLQTLTLMAHNWSGEPSPASRLLSDILHRVYKEAGLDEDAAQSGLLNAFFASGGPTPQLVERIVRTGKVPYEAKHLVQVDRVKLMYDLMRELYEDGLDVRDFAEWLAELESAVDPTVGLVRKWGTGMVALVPYLWPPAVSAAFFLGGRRATEGKPHEEWLRENFEFLQRIWWRDDQRARREARRVGLELDAPVETDEGSVSPREVVPGRSHPELEAEIGVLLDGVELTKRERQVAELLSQGYRNTDIAELLGLTPGRLSHIVSQLRRKIPEKP